MAARLAGLAPVQGKLKARRVTQQDLETNFERFNSSIISVIDETRTVMTSLTERNEATIHISRVSSERARQ